MSRKTSDNYQHHAVTHHTKGAADGELVTISIVDGLGQPIQLKKTHYVGGSQLKWLVSGFEEKDVLGRAVKTYLPQLQNNANNALSTTALSYMNPSDFSAPPLIKKYDAKNRPTKITQPGENNSTDIEYSIEGNRAVSETTNEEGQTLKTYTDIRGQQRKTVQNDQITTEFDYNTVGELIKVTNTNGYQTKYEYDLAGRRTAEKSPDRGLTEFTYDKAGHLIKKQTANLMQPGNNGSIEYKYHYDRLTHIIYPNHPENNVVYEYGTTADEDKNQTGRLRLQKDATGLQYFEYDDMGNVETNIRAVAVAGRTAYWFETQWEYDSWNRIKTITYPDNEEVSYHYDKAGQVRAVTSDMNLWDLISNLTYDEYGQRRTVVYGNDTKIQYKYDNRQRLKILTNSFPADGDIYKKYTYDPLSNIKEIATLDNNNLLGTPEAGGLAGPMKYEFTYDDFNRLKESGGFYVGPNDFPTEQHALLRQQYSLGMQYDEQHNITRKYQNHQQAEVSNLSAPSQLQRVNKTSYVLNYEDYGTAGMSSGDYSYVQPHAPRKIIETPLGVNDPNEIQTKVKEVNYDADGNMTTIKQKIKDPDNQLVEEEMTLRHYRWDEEDRLRAVDLMPDNNPKMPEISNYTYDADGERIVRYVPGRLDAFYSANQAGFSDRLERFIYPSGLLTVKTLPLKPGTDLTPRMNLTTYTKHYYIGSERIVSSLGRANDLGLFCKDFQIYGVDDYLNEMDSKTTQAGEVLNADYQYFEKLLNLSPPILYNNSVLGCSLV
ncbi:MAG TPA: hypothetical protein VK021_05820, partial [Flavobacteriaceae bacterium]|nr:hypothetical protein [Flavobacteriaceae bacterium]